MKAHGFYFTGRSAGLSAFFSHVGSTAMAWACELCFVLFPAFYYYPSCRLWAGRGGREKRQAVWVRTGAVPLFFSLSSYGQICPLEMLSALLGLYLLLGAGGLLGCHFIRKFIGLRPGGSIHEKDL